MSYPAHATPRYPAHTRPRLLEIALTTKNREAALWALAEAEGYARITGRRWFDELVSELAAAEIQRARSTVEPPTPLDDKALIPARAAVVQLGALGFPPELAGLELVNAALDGRIAGYPGKTDRAPPAADAVPIPQGVWKQFLRNKLWRDLSTRWSHSPARIAAYGSGRVKS